MLMMSVLPRYGKKGIAGQLIAKSLEIAKRDGFSLAVANFTSMYTQRIGKRLGFEKLLEINYEESFAKYADIPTEIRDTHRACHVMAKILF